MFNQQQDNRNSSQPPRQLPNLPPPPNLQGNLQTTLYPLPTLPSLGNGGGGGFTIPSINQNKLLPTTNSNHQIIHQNQPTNVTTPTAAQQAVEQVASLGGIPNRSSASNAYRPLNVKDALSYLDQVKIQFYNQADVYNKFLDIMKEFKSNSINTPGVIERVSTLFKGHTNLIQGFNTFLPAGYKISCDLNEIRVTTPSGSSNLYNQRSDEGEQHYYQEPVSAPPQQNGGEKNEFNHAISYVNKIKTRFANQPDIYKQFLEILQTYQREQKPIAEVYEQVTQLFANSPDLLDDFKQFLPDTSNQQPQQSQSTQDVYQNGNQLPPVGNFQPAGPSPTQPAYQFYQPTDQHVYEQHQTQAPSQLTPQQLHPSPPQQSQPPQQPHLQSQSQQIPPPHQPQPLQVQPQMQHQQQPHQQQQQALQQPPQPQQSMGKTKQKQITPPVNPTLVPGIPEPVPPSGAAKSSSLSEEISFFDKVKKAIGNKQTYSDFLKVLNLFTQDIIDKDTLVERVEGFLGGANYELFNWFKMFVGYEDKPQTIENVTFKKHQLELSYCKAYGPSYRQLPKSETYMPCSGRDEMCWEVLNDEWVGHPTWASEDSGFIAHRKNQYEEMLFKIEEERLEFDYYMESNLRTIQILETIANRIANMTPEQKASFKLPPGLGHNSQTIYKKVIRKIYDKDRGFEVIDALHDNPAIAVPIVLKRLKQKDEEWKRAQREWNKVWREMEQKVFYKSLDHLGLTFKQADKKLLTAKQLVSEISTVKVEQQNKRLHPLTPKSQEQLNYKLDDKEILFDVMKLADVFINRSSNYSSHDREKLSQFFQFFISTFFGIPSEEIDKKIDSRGKVEAIEEDSKKRPRDTDLLKDVLKKQSKKIDRPDTPPEVNEDLEQAKDLWIDSANTKFSLPETTNTRRIKYNLFCNTTIYVFFRHLTTLYERLKEIKNMSDKVGKEIKTRKFPQFAKDLNLLSHQLEDMGVAITGDNCYQQILELSEKLIEGEVEHQIFEESLRQGFRNKAYKIYTIDKVVQALVKHMHTIITDAKTSEMILLFENDRGQPVSSAKEQILYRIAVRGLMSPDENMFKIAINEKDLAVNIQFISLDDLTINDHQNSEEAYNYYVTSYVMSHPTEGVPASKLNMPFFKPFIEQVDEDSVEGRSASGLKVSINENSYKLTFESNTHDEYISSSVYKRDERKEEKSTDLINMIESEFGWKSTLEDEEDADFHSESIQILYEKGGNAFKEYVAKDKTNTSEVTEVKEGDKEDIEMEQVEAKISQEEDQKEDLKQKELQEGSKDEVKEDVEANATNETLIPDVNDTTEDNQE